MIKDLYEMSLIIKSFFKNYSPSKWNDLIVILLEYSIIHISNTYSGKNLSFNAIYDILNKEKQMNMINIGPQIIDNSFVNKQYTLQDNSESIVKYEKNNNQSLQGQTSRSRVEELIEKSPIVRSDNYVIIDEDKDKNEILLKVNKETYDKHIKINDEHLSFKRNTPHIVPLEDQRAKDKSQNLSFAKSYGKNNKSYERGHNKKSNTSNYTNYMKLNRNRPISLLKKSSESKSKNLITSNSLRYRRKSKSSSPTNQTYGLDHKEYNDFRLNKKSYGKRGISAIDILNKLKEESRSLNINSKKNSDFLTSSKFEEKKRGKLVKDNYEDRLTNKRKNYSGNNKHFTSSKFIKNSKAIEYKNKNRSKTMFIYLVVKDLETGEHLLYADKYKNEQNTIYNDTNESYLSDFSPYGKSLLFRSSTKKRDI